jgi:putative hydroxymethylpyrimidine transport system substrate-binding protein
MTMRVGLRWTVLSVAFALGLGAGLPYVAQAQGQPVEKVRMILDWFPNADHVPLYVARDTGIFKKFGLEVEFVPPADPNDPLKLVAAGQAAFAMSYQPSVTIARAEGLPIKAIGVLVDRPLSCLLYLKTSGIKSAADLRGKKIGYSVETLDLPLMHVVAASGGLKRGEYTPVNIRFNLTSSLLTGQVDAVMGAFWTYELLEVEREHRPGAYLTLEKNGVPHYNEMVIISSDAFLKTGRDTARRFVLAIQEGIAFSRAKPKEAFALFAKANPEAKEDLDREAFTLTLPLYAKSQVQPPEGWTRWAKFAKEHGLVNRVLTADDLLVNVAAP